MPHLDLVKRYYALLNTRDVDAMTEAVRASIGRTISATRPLG